MIPNYNNSSPINKGDDLVTRGNMLLKIRRPILCCWINPHKHTRVCLECQEKNPWNV